MQNDQTPSPSSTTGPAEGLDPAASLLDALEAYAPAPTLDTERNRRRRRQAIAGAMAEVLKNLAEDIRKERRAEAGAAEVRLAQALERIHGRLEPLELRHDSTEGQPEALEELRERVQELEHRAPDDLAARVARIERDVPAEFLERFARTELLLERVDELEKVDGAQSTNMDTAAQELAALAERVGNLEQRLSGPAAMHQRRIEQLEERVEELTQLGAKYLATERQVEDIHRRTATITADTFGEQGRRLHELEALHELDDEHATTAESLKEHRREVIQGVAKLVDRLRALEGHVGDRPVGETVQRELEATVAPSTEALAQRLTHLEGRLGSSCSPDPEGTPLTPAIMEDHLGVGRVAHSERLEYLERFQRELLADLEEASEVLRMPGSPTLTTVPSELARRLRELDAAMSERITELEDRPPVAVISHEQHRDLAGALDELVGQRLKDNAARLEKLEEKAATPAPHGLGLAEHLETMGTQINRAHARCTSIEAQGRVDDLTLRVLALEGDSAEAHLTPGAPPAWRAELEARVEQLEQRRQHLEIRGEGWDAQLRAFLDASRDHTQAGAEMLTRVQALEHRVAELGHAPEPTPAPEPMPSPPGGIPSIILRACRGEDADSTPAAAELSKLATLIGALWRPAQELEAQAFREQAELVVRELLAAVRKLHPTREEGTAYLDAQVHAHLEAAHRPLLARLEELGTQVRELEEQPAAALERAAGEDDRRTRLRHSQRLHILERAVRGLNAWHDQVRERLGPLERRVGALEDHTREEGTEPARGTCECEHVKHGEQGCQGPAAFDHRTALGTFRVCGGCLAAACMHLDVRERHHGRPLAFTALQVPKEERVPWLEGERIYWRHDLGRYSYEAGDRPAYADLAGTVLRSANAAAGRAELMLEPGFHPVPEPLQAQAGPTKCLVLDEVDLYPEAHTVHPAGKPGAVGACECKHEKHGEEGCQGPGAFEWRNGQSTTRLWDGCLCEPCMPLEVIARADHPARQARRVEITFHLAHAIIGADALLDHAPGHYRKDVPASTCEERERLWQELVAFARVIAAAPEQSKEVPRGPDAH